jgi:hypothetical protein
MAIWTCALCGVEAETDDESVLPTGWEWDGDDDVLCDLCSMDSEQVPDGDDED